MPIDPAQALLYLRADLEAYPVPEEMARFAWAIEPWPLTSLLFYITMTSNVDQQSWMMRLACDNYPEWPPSIKCVNPQTKDPNDANAWPKCQGFRPASDLCMNISREGLMELHPDWQRTSYKWPQGGNPIYYVLISLQTRLDDPTKYTSKG
jgi:hypothetical protein